jgi:hypothetical protein
MKRGAPLSAKHVRECRREGRGGIERQRETESEMYSLICGEKQHKCNKRSRQQEERSTHNLLCEEKQDKCRKNATFSQLIEAAYTYPTFATIQASAHRAGSWGCQGRQATGACLHTTYLLFIDTLCIVGCTPFFGVYMWGGRGELSSRNTDREETPAFFQSLPI